jgi:hypothetical protein
MTETLTVNQEAKTLSGVHGNNSLNISVYPNPVSEVLNITGAAGMEFSLINAQGKSVLHKRITDNQEVLPMSSLPEGVYLAKVGNYLLRIVKKQ